MKRLVAVVVILTSSIISLPGMAQYVPKQAKTQAVQRPKAQLFKELPETFTIDQSLLASIFSSSPGDKIRVPVTRTQFLDGIVSEKAQKNAHVVSVNVRATNFSGALFSLSQITDSSQLVNYIGRILNVKYGDAFLLKKRDNQYIFVKTAQSQVLPD